MSNFVDDINEQSKNFGGGVTGIFSFKELEPGTYPIRILNKPIVLATHFFGKGVPSVVCVGIDKGCVFHKEDENKRPSIRLVTYIIERSSKEIKLAELPLSLSYGIQDLQNDPDYAFEVFPMPYDIKVIHDPKNKDPKAKYRVGPPGKVEKITKKEGDELKELMDKMTPEDYVEKRKKKQMDKGKNEDIRDTDNYPTAEEEEIDPDDIPLG